MTQSEKDRSLSPEAGIVWSRVLDRLEIEPLLADCVADLVKSRTDRPLEEMLSYFATVNSLAHVAQREFDFINACAHNRRAFLLSFERAYGHYADGELRPGELLQLVLLLCPDFPESFVLDVDMLLQADHEVDFGTLKTVFYVYFFFHAHLRALRQHFDGRASEPRLVTLAQVKDITDQVNEQASTALPAVPDMFLEAAFLDRDGRQNFALPFNSFMAAVVRSRDLVKWLLRPPASRGWERHAQVPEVAALFRAPGGNLNDGNLGGAHSDRATKTTKSKGQKQRPREKKAKSLAS